MKSDDGYSIFLTAMRSRGEQVSAVSSASPRSFGGIVWPDQLFNPEEQLFGMKRLGEEFEVVATALGVFQNLGGLSLPGEEQDMTAWKLLTNRDCQLDAVHTWHYNIAEDEVGDLLPANFEGCCAVVSSLCGVALGMENQHEGVGNAFFIIDNQDEASLGIRGRT